ncbi:uncharacterized protein LOC125812423 [Solanum verrucosum]|uniref:uncharacterized protein LOC125812423 n=1 Tax=Solanum verrucosum TaxID=315347 RepID=UPI0020D15284|nr:uncharacterized protein LOC125812423 [Solanum verrucosum]
MARAGGPWLTPETSPKTQPKNLAKVKRFFVWLNVNEIFHRLGFRVDFPSSGSIYFQVGFINKKLDIKQFETLHSCRDNGLALCGGTSLRQLPAPVNNMEMLVTE